MKTDERHVRPSDGRPALNYCSHCGSPLEDRYAFGRERRYCPRCKRVIFREHKVAAALLMTRDDREVLLVQRAQGPYRGRWSLPAGFVDGGETPADAAVRECLEETGLEVKITQLLDVIGEHLPAGRADILIVYRGVMIGGALAAGDDASDACFFSVDDLPALAFTSTRQTLDRWLSQRKRSR